MDKFYLFLFYSFRGFVRFTPEVIQEKIIRALSGILYLLDKKHRKIIEINLDFTFDGKISSNEKKRIAKKCYTNMLFFLTDFIKNQGITKEELQKKVSFENEHILKEAIKNKEKIILITAHYGNWELLALCMGAFFGKMTGIGRALESKSVDKILRKNREQFDIEMLEKRGAMKGMIKALKEGRMVGVLIDQNTADSEGVLVDFFGKKARQTHSTSLLSRKLNASIIPAFITTDDYKHYKITFYDKIVPEESIQELTQKQANVLENVIKEKPDEWFWFHKKWKNQYEEIYR